MNVKYLWLLLLALVLPLLSSAQWVPVSQVSPYMNAGICFTNADTGYTVSLNGEISQTYTGGASWSTTITPGYNWALTCVSFPNNKIGYTGGQDGVLFKTTDGGATWSRIQDLSCPYIACDFFNMHFLNPDTGFALTYYGQIYRTADGAATWTQVGSLSDITHFINEGSIQFINDTIGFIAGNDTSKFAKTIDGGNTWQVYNTGGNMHVNELRMINENTGVAVGYNGKVVRTTDGGNTWTPPVTIGMYHLMGVDFFNDTLGYAVGGYDNQYCPHIPSPQKGIIYRTTDGGVSWTAVDSSYTKWLTDIQVLNDSTGFITGWNGIVLKTTTAGYSFTAVNDLSQAHDEMQLFPDPAEDHLSIVLPKDVKNAEIKIYDIAGRIVLEYPVSSNAFAVELDHLLPGIYIAVIHAGDKSFTKQFVRQ